MAKVDKLIERMKSVPSDFTWRELSKILKSLGYEEVKTSKTGGSRRCFAHEKWGKILLHKPHPQEILVV